MTRDVQRREVILENGEAKETADGLAQPVRTVTASGFPIKEFYTPEDVAGIDYRQDIADPGEFPFVRGIHRTMYRGRAWSRNTISGFGAPSDTNERLRTEIATGRNVINVIYDLPSNHGIDADHPMAEDEVGVCGVSVSSLADLEELFEGIPMATTMMLNGDCGIAGLFKLAGIVTMAKRRGIEPSLLRGGVHTDPLQHRYCGYRASHPIDLCLKLAVDAIEYKSKHMPLWTSHNPHWYNLRDQGINAAEEVAMGLGIYLAYIDEAQKRGLSIDDFAPRVAATLYAGMDFFEEIAKFRAARRMWARIARDEYGAKNAKSTKLKITVHTAGRSLTNKHPLLNIARVAIESLAAVLGGVQAVDAATYEEAIGITSEEAQVLSYLTQLVILHETGAASVSDPLGGSYYIENLTNKIEQEATQILEQIEAMGGMVEAITTGWVDRRLDEGNIHVEREIQTGERVVVGLNAYTDLKEATPPTTVYTCPPDRQREIVARVKRLRETRDRAQVAEAIAKLRETATGDRRVNLMPAIIEAVGAYATQGEVLGAIRESYGHSYDPWGMITAGV